MIHIPNTGLRRRAFLRGLGACIALPALEVFHPLARAAAAGTRPLGVTKSGMPMRTGFVAFANGSNYERWLPKGTGRDYELNETFAPMADLKPHFQVLTNLAHDAANNWGDGSGDRALGCFIPHRLPCLENLGFPAAPWNFGGSNRRPTGRPSHAAGFAATRR